MSVFSLPVAEVPVTTHRTSSALPATRHTTVAVLWRAAPENFWPPPSRGAQATDCSRSSCLLLLLSRSTTHHMSLDDREILELRQLCTVGGLAQDSLASLIDAGLAVPSPCVPRRRRWRTRRRRASASPSGTSFARRCVSTRTMSSRRSSRRLSRLATTPRRTTLSPRSTT